MLNSFRSYVLTNVCAEFNVPMVSSLYLPSIRASEPLTEGKTDMEITLYILQDIVSFGVTALRITSVLWEKGIADHFWPQAAIYGKRRQCNGIVIHDSTLGKVYTHTRASVVDLFITD